MNDSAQDPVSPLTPYPTTPPNPFADDQAQSIPPLPLPVADDQTQTPVDIGGVTGDKEAEPLPQPEVVPLVELKEDEKIPEEVEGWLEHLKQDHVIDLPEIVTDEDQKALLANAHAKVVDDKIVLPMTQEEMQQGLHAKVMTSARWLAEWSLRIMKIFGDRAEYRKE